jgi:hypothetical protein
MDVGPGHAQVGPRERLPVGLQVLEGAFHGKRADVLL